MIPFLLRFSEMVGLPVDGQSNRDFQRDKQIQVHAEKDVQRSHGEIKYSRRVNIT